MTAVRTSSAASSPSRGGRSAGSAAPRDRTRRLHLVRSVTSRELGWRATIAVCVIGSFAALVVSVAIQAQRISLQEEADRIAAKTAVARDRSRQLRIEVIQAESPEQILGAARRAGMVDPGPIAMVPAATTGPATTDPSAPSSVAPPPAGVTHTPRSAGTAGDRQAAARG